MCAYYGSGMRVLVMSIIGAVASKGQTLYSSDPALTVECSGTESDLSECTIGLGNCSVYSYAGVSCQPSESTPIVYTCICVCPPSCQAC